VKASAEQLALEADLDLQQTQAAGRKPPTQAPTPEASPSVSTGGSIHPRTSDSPAASLSVSGGGGTDSGTPAPGGPLASGGL